MSNKVKIVRQKDVFKVVCSAVNNMVDFIRPTYGPANNKIIVDKFAYKMTMDDGVQGARDYEESFNPEENAVVRLVREVAVRTNDRQGDGTTSSLIILQAIINEVARRSRFDGRKVVLELKQGLEELKTQLTKNSIQIKTKEDLKKVAMVSFDDEKIAEMIADTYYKLGPEGIITIDRSPTMETVIEKTEGLKLKSGYISPYMITNPSRMETVIEKPYILITDYRLTEANDLFPILDKMAKDNKRQLVIIADNVEGNALATLVVNMSHVMNQQTGKPGSFQVVAIAAPREGNKQILLEDLALMTGAKMFSQSKGDKVDKAEIKDLGRCERFISIREESIMVGPKGRKGEVGVAVTTLRQAIKNEKNEKKKEELKKRLGMFTNTLAVIKVGALTDNEQKALKYKVEDCVHSVKSAYQHGVVPGSGIALAGVKTSSPILNEALKYPHRQLMENMGITDNKNRNEKNTLNVVTMKEGHFMEVGVVDPVDVLIAGAESAVSIASILLTSAGMLVEYNDETTK